KRGGAAKRRGGGGGAPRGGRRVGGRPPRGGGGPPPPVARPHQPARGPAAGQGRALVLPALQPRLRGRPRGSGVAQAPHEEDHRRGLPRHRPPRRRRDGEAARARRPDARRLTAPVSNRDGGVLCTPGTMPTRIAGIQPGYLPWLGYFDQMRRVDAFIIADEMQFSSSGWAHRNRVRGPDGAHWLTLPARPRPEQRICDVALDPTVPWAKKHLRTLR